MENRNPCPECGASSKIRSSRHLSKDITERYLQCNEPSCRCVFKTQTLIVSIIHTGLNLEQISENDETRKK